MGVDPFTERLARVRHRFVSSLEGKIEDTYGALPGLTGATPAAIEAVRETYRRIHSLVGVGPTVGFSATGSAARSLEIVLMPAHQAGRGLTDEEASAFRKTLHGLRDAASHELRSFYAGWR